MKKKILVSGPVLTRSGYGEMGRFALRALRTREDVFDIYVNPLAWGHTGWISEDSEERSWIDQMVAKTVAFTQQSNNQPAYDAALQISIPNEWKPMAPINVGYTAGIETNRVSPHWIQPSNNMNRIIVISEFGKKSYDNAVYNATDNKTGQQITGFRVVKPVDVVGFPVRKSEPANIELPLATDFNFLVVAQGGPRKNLTGIVQWFIEEFKNDENVGLVCKTHLAGASQIDREMIYGQLETLLNNHKDRKCKIYLLHGDMTESEMAALYTHPKIKALVSLSHGEGFGLPIFEASYYGLPVVTTEWSGPVDFMYCPNKEGKIKPHFARVDFTLGQVQKESVWQGVIEADTMWAFPSGNSAKAEMREVFKNHDRFRGQAKRLMEHNIKTFTEEAVYSKFVDSIFAAFGSNVPSIQSEKVQEIEI
jgi:glycosyltransferase involved in cell wall biosynthesis